MLGVVSLHSFAHLAQSVAMRIDDFTNEGLVSTLAPSGVASVTKLWGESPRPPYLAV
jgi:hypothetical protein